MCNRPASSNNNMSSTRIMTPTASHSRKFQASAPRLFLALLLTTSSIHWAAGEYVIPPVITEPQELAMLQLLDPPGPCLDEPTIPRNVSWGGREQPVTVLDSQWTSSWVVHRIFIILLRERLGIDARSQVGTSTSRFNLRFIAGCHSNLRQTQQECDLDPENPPVSMFALENWSQFNSHTTPKDLQPAIVNMEYEGFEGTFVPEPILQRGLVDRGLHLEYWGSWDHDWQNPSKYSMKLADWEVIMSREGWIKGDCKDKLYVVEGDVARDYGKWTGDSDGVVMVNGTATLRCDHPAHPGWYMTSRCRRDPETCTPLMTVSGYGGNFMLQQLEASKASVAFASVPWGTYVAIGRSGLVPHYWWVPDAAFIMNKPNMVVFPPYDSDRAALGDLRRQQKSTPMAKFMARGVEEMSSKLGHVFRRLSFSQQGIMSLLEQSLNETDNDKLACQWLKNPANQARWNSWLPNPRDCDSGYGLKWTVGQRQPVCTMCEGGSFSEFNGTHRLCVDCPRGFYCTAGSSQAQQCDEGAFCPQRAKLPVQCPLATYQPGLQAIGQDDCLPCPAGTYADDKGSIACKACTEGTYSPGGLSAKLCPACPISSYSGPGAFECTDCPIGFVTTALSAPSSAYCTCPSGTVYLPSVAVEGNATGACMPCGATNTQPEGAKYEGLVCPGGFVCSRMENSRLTASFPCDDLCVASAETCKTQCVIPMGIARELCESPRFLKICQGWSTKSWPLLKDRLDAPDRRSGKTYSWANVAILGTLEIAPGRTVYDSVPSAADWTFFPQRRHCPTPQMFGTNISMRVQQPPLVRVGHYLTFSTPLERENGAENTSPSREDPDARFSMGALAIALQPGRNLRVFRCMSAVSCPGGLADTCFPGEGGLACGFCTINHYTTSGGCVPCAGSGSDMLVLIVVLVVLLEVVLLALYVVTDSPLSAKVAGTMATALAVSSTINGLQTFSVFSMIAVEWPSPVSEILDGLKIFTLDVDALQWECVAPVTPVAKFSVKLLLPAFVGFSFLGLCAISRLIPAHSRYSRWRMKLPHTVNCIGTVVQLLFISICLGLIIPFKCQSNPAGVQTLVDYPSVQCGAAEHQILSQLGIAFLVLYPGVFFAGSAYLVRVLPSWTARYPGTLRYCKFLVCRFRPDRYYFGIIFLARNLMLGIAPIVNPGSPIVQCLVLTLVLLLALVAQLLLWPWAVPAVNFLDSFCLVCFLTCTVASAGLTGVGVDAAIPAEAEPAVIAMTASLVGVGVTMILVVIHVARVTLIEWKTKVPVRSRHHKASLVKLTADLRVVCRALSYWQDDSIAEFLGALSPFDAAVLDKAVDLITTSAEVPSTALDQTTGSPMRITLGKLIARQRTSAHGAALMMGVPPPTSADDDDSPDLKSRSVVEEDTIVV